MAVTLLNLEVLKSFSQWLNELRQAGTIINLGFTKYNLAELPTQLEPAKYERMIFGIILILMMIFRPGGMIPERRHKLEMEDG
jgi:branched-chain amino acid transport system permease protein